MQQPGRPGPARCLGRASAPGIAFLARKDFSLLQLCKEEGGWRGQERMHPDLRMPWLGAVGWPSNSGGVYNMSSACNRVRGMRR
jgi:hypothetical protein